MKNPRHIQIACILNNTGQTYWALCNQGMRDQAYEHGIAFTVHLTYTNAQAQAVFMDCLHQPNLDALILAGADFVLTSQASAPRFPLIVCDADLAGMTPACNLKPDLRRAATLAATHLVAQLQGRGNVIQIEGFPNQIFTLPRSEGFAAVLAEQPHMAIVFAAAGDFDRARAAHVMQAALSSHPDLKGVFAHSDAMALGALDVLAAAGRHDVLVVGIDGIPESLTAIHAGRMAGTVATSPYRLGRMALAHALQIVQGQPTPTEILTDVRLISAANLLDATFDTVRVFPNVLRTLIEDNQTQQRLQNEIIATQRSLIEGLSTPIIPVSDSILVVPLIGAIDTLRARQITEALLEAASRQHTQVLIIDITGVAVVDTNVVNYLMQTARAARLLGTTVLLVGIGPEVAQTIVQLGVDLSSIVTRSTLQGGLEYARAQVRR